MKLLITSTAYPPSIGGAQLHMHQLARGLNTHHTVQVLTHWDSNRTDWLLGTTITAPLRAKDYTVDGVSVHRLGLPPMLRLKILPWVVSYYLIQGLAIKQISNMLMERIENRVAQADLVHNCRIGREGLSYASYQIAREYNIPFVLTPVHHPRWEGWLHRYYLRLYRLADAVIALTNAEKTKLCNLGVDEQRVFVTGIGPILAKSYDPVAFRVHFGIKDQPIILFLGQKYEYKGLSALLEAAEIVWQKIPDAYFVFVGPRTKYSRRLFSNVSDRRVIELDAVGLQEKTNILAACDLLCVPSTQESFGGVYTEAWNLGKPVIGCNIPAVSDVVIDGFDGYLVKQKPDQIANRILELILNPALGKEIGKRGEQKVKDHFNWDNIVHRTIEVYRNIL
jgi:glycosyltransferase involved in cell wall biosynthesis